MSDCIRYTRENVENTVGDALKGVRSLIVHCIDSIVRQRAMVAFRDLGQPDLCYLVKIRNRLLQPLGALWISKFFINYTLRSKRVLPLRSWPRCQQHGAHCFVLQAPAGAPGASWFLSKHVLIGRYASLLPKASSTIIRSKDFSTAATTPSRRPM